MKTLRRFLIRISLGANVLAELLLLLCGLSSMLNPVDFPRLALVGLGFPVFLLLNLFFLFFWLVFYVRYIWFPILGLLLSATFIFDYCPIRLQTDKPMGCLKLLTYNIEGFHRGVSDDKGNQPILDYIVASNADIICLQECNSSNKKLTSEHIDSLMHNFGYRAIRHEKIKSPVVFTRLPIISTFSIPYESLSNGSIAAELFYQGDTILLINNHLESYKLNGEDKKNYKEIIIDPENKETEHRARKLINKMAEATKLRGPQVDSVSRYIKLSGRNSVIVCGDLNSSPISYSCHRLSEKLKSAYTQSGFGPGFSYNQNGFYFRIDHIFISDYWQSYQTTVDKSINQSDHYPLITYLKKRKI